MNWQQILVLLAQLIWSAFASWYETHFGQHPLTALKAALA